MLLGPYALGKGGDRCCRVLLASRGLRKSFCLRAGVLLLFVPMVLLTRFSLTVLVTAVADTPTIHSIVTAI